MASLQEPLSKDENAGSGGGGVVEVEEGEWEVRMRKRGGACERDRGVGGVNMFFFPSIWILSWRVIYDGRDLDSSSMYT